MAGAGVTALATEYVSGIGRWCFATAGIVSTPSSAVSGHICFLARREQHPNYQAAAAR